jgi:hypothetical protein
MGIFLFFFQDKKICVNVYSYSDPVNSFVLIHIGQFVDETTLRGAELRIWIHEFDLFVHRPSVCDPWNEIFIMEPPGMTTNFSRFILDNPDEFWDDMDKCKF